ncbi:MAG: glycoside hydrolase family 3 protein [Paludibacteraceae bacterium]|nr:glycoside hydrolase family 3 protein [Paludibacteraceae bacterium]
MKKILIVNILLLILLSACTPQLGRSSDERVIAAMTLEEKVSLLVGTCKDWNLVPEAAPATRHREPVPEGYWDTYQGNTAAMRGKVSGAAGISYAIPRLGIPPVVMADGPVGLRIDSVCTAFPSTALLAASNDTDLVCRVGQAIGEEMRYYGVDILLAPGINIMRNPLCGRNYEYLSADPDWAGRIASAYVRGVQSKGVGTCVKHFAANNQETYRNGIDVQVDDSVLRRLYLKPFEQVVWDAQPWTLMSSYNKINGTYASENAYLLTDILRNEWGFEGFVMTDWWAEEDPVRMQLAGNDMLMPGTQEQIDTLIAAVRSGRLDEAVLDRNLLHILPVIRRCPAFLYGNRTNPDGADLDRMLREHAALAREAAAKGMVLLRNRHALPLDASVSSVALLGKGSYDTYAGGTGSGAVTKAYKVNICEALERQGFRPDSIARKRYMNHIALSYDAQPDPSAWFMPYVSELEWTQQDMNRLAQTNDICILTLQRMAGEGTDRQLVEGDYYLTSVEKNLIRRASQAFHTQGKPLVLILNTGSTLELTDVVGYTDAVLMAWLPGQEAGNAVADVLTGAVPPQGKLPMPFYGRYSDVPSAPNFPLSDGDPNKVCYREGLARPARTLYDTGFGLTY